MSAAVIGRAVACWQHIASECLDGGSWQHAGQFGQMSATLDAGQTIFQFTAKAAEQVESDELLLRRSDRIAVPRIGHGI